MPTHTDHLRALRRICRRLGGSLALVSQDVFDSLFHHRPPLEPEGLSEAPFTDAHGIWWHKKIIYAVRGRERIGALIHEMGHVFASPHHPYCECTKCSEWTWFGWEIALARRIHAARLWSRQNANYVTTEYNETSGSEEWGKLTARQRRHIILDRLTAAREAGLLDEKGTPRSLR